MSDKEIDELYEELETYNEEFAICPYCKEKHEDCWEWNCENETQVDCQNCDKKFNVSSQTNTTYTTTKL